MEPNEANQGYAFDGGVFSAGDNRAGEALSESRTERWRWKGQTR